MTTVQLLTANTVNGVDTVDFAKSGEAVKSGPIGFAVILVLCVACYFLFKSMSRHLKKVREEFPTDEPAETTGAPADRPPQPGPALPPDGSGKRGAEPREQT